MAYSGSEKTQLAPWGGAMGDRPAFVAKTEATGPTIYQAVESSQTINQAFSTSQSINRTVTQTGELS